jgi:OTU domain-containing protein 3
VHALARLLKRDIRIVHANVSLSVLDFVQANVQHSDTIPCTYDPASVPTATPEPEALVPVITPDHEIPSTPKAPPRRRTRSSTINLLQTPTAIPPSSPLYASTLEQYLPTARDGRNMLWIALLNNAEHYQSVRRKGDHDRTPAEIEDRLALPHGKDRSESARIARGELPAPSAQPSKSNVSIVFSSLPAGHAFTSAYITGILARVKGDIGAAVEILIEEMDTLSEISDETNSDGKVEQMLAEVEETPPVDQHPPTLASDPTEYRESVSDRRVAPGSPSSSITSAGHTSESDDVSRSSIATTPSTGSLRSTRSKRSTSSATGSKPYDRPAPIVRKKGKELSKELEELKVGSSSGARADRVITERRKSTAESADKRKSQLDDLKAARERQKLKVRV